MDIAITIRSSYGETRVYVVDDQQKRALSALTGTKTLTKSHLISLASLGHTFTVSDRAARNSITNGDIDLERMIHIVNGWAKWDGSGKNDEAGGE